MMVVVVVVVVGAAPTVMDNSSTAARQTAITDKLALLHMNITIHCCPVDFLRQSLLLLSLLYTVLDLVHRLVVQPPHMHQVQHSVQHHGVSRWRLRQHAEQLWRQQVLTRDKERIRRRAAPPHQRQRHSSAEGPAGAAAGALALLPVRDCAASALSRAATAS